MGQARRPLRESDIDGSALEYCVKKTQIPSIQPKSLRADKFQINPSQAGKP